MYHCAFRVRVRRDDAAKFMKADDVAETIARILDVYVAHREEGEEFLETYRRIGVDPFKARVYATAH